MVNLKPVNLFIFFFALACERIFVKTHRTDNRCVISAENILFVGASVHRQPEILQVGAVKGLICPSTGHQCIFISTFTSGA